MGRMKDLFGDTPYAPAPYGGHPPFQKASDASRSGADAIQPAAASIREKVFQFIAAAPRTNEEISKALGLRIQTVCGRVGELRSAGRIEDSGERRPGSSGVRATVWWVRK